MIPENTNRVIEETSRDYPDIGSVLLGRSSGDFSVLVLAPAFALSLAMVVVSFAYFGHDLLRPLLEFAVLITNLQIGYVARHAFVFNSQRVATPGNHGRARARGCLDTFLRKGLDAYLRTQ